MKGFRHLLLLLLIGLLLAPAAPGQNLDLVWPECETSAVPRRGPETASGLLVYFHGRGLADSTKDPILGLFREMAKVAQWDVLRINRKVFADLEDGAEDILQIVSEEVERARRDGYRKIIVAGGSRGGWLALLAATLPGVDAAIGLGPATGTHEPADLARTRDLLAEKLAGAKAPRVAAVFFEGDLGVADGRAASVRGGLQRSGSAFLVVDQPVRSPFAWDSRHRPTTPSEPKTWIQYLTLVPDESGRGLVFKYPGGTGEWAVELTSALQLQVNIRSSNERGERVLPRSFAQATRRRIRSLACRSIFAVASVAWII